MKPLRKIATALALVAMVTFACQKEEEEKEVKDFLTVEGLQEPTVIEYDQAAPLTFTVESNKSWTIGKKNLDWLAVSPGSGAAGQKVTVTLTATANGETAREGTLEVYAGSMSETYTIKQTARPIVPTLTVTGAANNAVAFEYNSAEAVNLTVTSNVPWTADKGNMDWLTVDPASGAAGAVEVSLTVTKNNGEARTGNLTITGEGAAPVVIAVSQSAPAPKLEVKDLTNNTISFEAASAAPVKFKINSNVAWTLEKSAEWVTVAPAAGEASDNDVEVTVSAADNTGDARAATVTVKSANSALQDVVITVSQEAAPAVSGPTTGVIACFTLSNESLTGNDVEYPDATWVTHGIMHSDDGRSTGTYHYFMDHEDAVEPQKIISSDGNGHYAIKWMWTGDYIEWSIPVSNLVAGSKVNIRFAVSGKRQNPKFMNVEYYDNGEWKQTSTKQFMAGNNDPQDVPITATFALGAADSILNIDETATFSQAIVNGNVRIRLLCIDGTYRADTGKTQGFVTSGHNTLRIRQWSPEGTPAKTEENNAILFTVVE